MLRYQGWLVLGLMGLASAAGAGPTGSPTLLTSEAQTPWLVRDGGSNRLLIVEKQGIIRVYKNGDLLVTPFLDLSAKVSSNGNERGMLGLVLDPEFSINGRFFVSYTDLDGDLDIERYTVSNNPDVANDASGAIVFHVPLPANTTDHIGGSLEFGPDGNLYIGIGTGDSGLACDSGCTAQRLDSYLGKVLRINVQQATAGKLYAIPQGNPYAADPNDDQFDEIWAIGLHDPRWLSFDSLTSKLYIADIGREVSEEINVQPDPQGTGGQNYGWKIQEGSTCHPCTTSDCPAPVPACGSMTEPLFEYAHTARTGDCHIVASGAYRGSSLASLQGFFIYGDECSGRVAALNLTGATSTVDFAQLDGLSSLEGTSDGRLFATAGNNVYQFVANAQSPTPTGTPDPFATRTPTPPPGATRTPTPSSTTPTPTDTPVFNGPSIVGEVVAKDTKVAFKNASSFSPVVQILDLSNNSVLGSTDADSLGSGVITLSAPVVAGQRIAAFDVRQSQRGPEVVVQPLILRGPGLETLGLLGILILALTFRRRSRLI